jgi:acetyl-CoA C-acetyltransferase
MNQPVIVSACRTPIGSFGGSLAQVTAPRLGAIAIAEAVKRAGVAPSAVDEVIMGNVLTAGEGQAPARQAALYAGLPDSVECMTVNKVCGSGMKSVMLAAQSVRAGDAGVVVAGGMESMSNVPYLLEKARSGYRMGHGELIDGIIKDGLWEVYNNYHMGNAAELCARECSISRKDQDQFSVVSYQRAQEAQATGRFTEEIVPVKIEQRGGGEMVVAIDEEPQKARFDKISQLKPAFQKDGTVTAANASKINDGAAALLVTSMGKATAMNLRPMAKIVAYATAAKQPAWFTTAPVDVIRKVLSKAGMTLDQIDLFEINEAFAVVTLAANRMLGIDPAKVNVNGGAVALGHPIGASGARIVVTLLHALRQRQMKRGLAAICIGGGEACGIIVELL